MPKIWKAGKLGKLVTQADFFAARFDAPWLGVITGVIGIASLIVYVQIQLVSLGLIVQLTLDGAISSHAATIVAGLLMIAFVFVAGIRSAAFAAGVKDVLIGKFPGLDASSPTTAVWLMTSAINIALGNWVFPHLFQMSYSARSATSIRRNAIWQPLYSLAYFFIILLGFAALLANTHPPGDNLNAALLQFVSERYPSWVIGLVAGTGFLLALAPGALLLVAAGSIFTRNVVRPFVPDLGEGKSLALSRASLVCFAGAAVYLSLAQKGSLVKILLDAYSAIGMIAPAVFLGFMWRRTTATGVLAGLLAGFVALLAPFFAHYWASSWPQWEPGLIAMAINAGVTVLVSLVTPAPAPTAIEIGLLDGPAPSTAARNGYKLGA